MKLLILFPSTIRGGAEEYVLTIASAAVKEGWEVHAAFPKRDEMTSLISDFITGGIHYHPLEICDIGGPYLHTKARHYSRLLRSLLLLWKIRPEVVLINLTGVQYGLAPIISCARLRIPTVVVFQLVRGEFKFSNNRLNAYAWARERGQYYVSVSEHNRILLSRSFRVSPDEINVVHNGCSVEFLPESPDKKTAARVRIQQELGIGEEEKLLLTVGRLDEQKGYHYLIPAIPHIVDEFPDIWFLWVGEGQWRERLISQVNKYGVNDKVLFLGYRGDVRELLHASDLFILPTLLEGLSFALLEAMMAGLPVVTTDVGGNLEVVSHMENAVVCPKKDVFHLRESVLYALRHPQEMKIMAAEAQTNARIRFSEEKTIKKTLGLLRDIQDSNK